MAETTSQNDLTANPLLGWLQRNWGLLLAVALVSIGWVAGRFIYEKIQKDKHDGTWSTFVDGAFTAEPNFDQLEADLEGTDAEPWIAVVGFSKALEDEDFDLARVYLERLGGATTHPLNNLSPLVGGEKGKPLSASLNTKIDAYLEWKKEHSFLFENPAPPEKPRVTIKTDKGDIVIALYPEHAEKAADNFIKLCSERFYDNSKVFEVRRNTSIRMGDPSTKDDDPAAWIDEGPGYTLPFEKTGLHHFEGAVSMYKKPGEKECSGSQFMISIRNQFYLDGQQTVFGQVVSGMEIVKELGQIESDYKTGKGVPKTLVKILETAVSE